MRSGGIDKRSLLRRGLAACGPLANLSVPVYDSIATGLGLLASVVQDLAFAPAAGSTLVQDAVPRGDC